MGTCCGVCSKQKRNQIQQIEEPQEKNKNNDNKSQNNNGSNKNLEAKPENKQEQSQIADKHEQYKQQSQQELQKQHYIPKIMKKRVKETVTVVKEKTGEGYKKINDYILIGDLGQGAYGQVKLAVKKKDQSEDRYAIKLFKKSILKRKREFYVDENGARKYRDALDDVKREIAIMKKLNHPNVIKLHEVIENPDIDKLYMVLDFAEGGQLIEWDEDEEKWFFCKDTQMEPYNEEYLRQLFRGCIKGLNYLHEHGIIHRDIKPQNILINSQQQPIISDFGVSAIMKDDDKLQNTKGTYYFMSPESLSKDQVNGGFSGKAADIWALGVTFYSFIYLQLPFFINNQYELEEYIKKKDLEFPIHRTISKDLKELLQLMLNKDPEKRITMEGLGENVFLNQSQEVSLVEEMKTNILEQVSMTEIGNAIQLSTVVRIKTWVSKWKQERKISSFSNITQQKEDLNDENPENSNQQQKFDHIITEQIEIGSSLKKDGL